MSKANDLYEKLENEGNARKSEVDARSIEEKHEAKPDDEEKWLIEEEKLRAEEAYDKAIKMGTIVLPEVSDLYQALENRVNYNRIMDARDEARKAGTDAMIAEMEGIVATAKRKEFPDTEISKGAVAGTRRAERDLK